MRQAYICVAQWENGGKGDDTSPADVFCVCVQNLSIVRHEFRSKV